MTQQDYVTKADFSEFGKGITENFDGLLGITRSLFDLVKSVDQEVTALKSSLTNVEGGVVTLTDRVDHLGHRVEYLDGKLEGTRDGVLNAIASLDQKCEQEFTHMVDKLNQILKWGAYREDLGR